MWCGLLLILAGFMFVVVSILNFASGFIMLCLTVVVVVMFVFCCLEFGYVVTVCLWASAVCWLVWLSVAVGCC